MSSSQPATRMSVDEADATHDLQTEAMYKEKRGSPITHQKQKGQSNKKRDTHFLCFPLVTNTSIPQLAKSLQHFRQVTTIPHHSGKRHSGTERSTESSARNEEFAFQPRSPRAEEHTVPIQQNTNQDGKLQSSNPDLQILPAVAHRPPGTFHLTLGVMDLSTTEEMDRALKLLQDLDYAAIFREVLANSEDVNDTLEGQSNHDADSSSNLDNTNELTLSSLRRPISPPRPNYTEGNMRFSKENPPSISLTGLSTFPSAKASRVFYAKPSPSSASPFPLLRFGQAIRRKFREAKFITETRPLVLHATVANMRYAVQARGGRTSKGKSWRHGKDRWKEGQVNAQELIKCFDCSRGNVEEYVAGKTPSGEGTHEFVWAEDIAIDRIAICKMGAEKSDDEVLGSAYPPVGEKMIFS